MPEAPGQVAHSSQSTPDATNAAEALPQVSFSDVTEPRGECATAVSRRPLGRRHPPGFDGYTTS